MNKDNNNNKNGVETWMVEGEEFLARILPLLLLLLPLPHLNNNNL